VLTQETVHDALKGKLAEDGIQMRSSIWADLVHSRYVRQVVRGDWDLERLRQLYLQKQETYFAARTPRRAAVREVEDKDARAKALNEVLARELSWYCGVDAFREQQLGGRLLAPEEITPWIKEQAAREGPVTGRYVTVPAPAREFVAAMMMVAILRDDTAAYARWLATRAEAVASDPTSELPFAATRGPLTLEYTVPGQGTSRIAIRGNGVLAQLKEIAFGAKGIGRLAGWTEQGAVAFILCGRIPTGRTTTVTTRFGAFAAAARVEIAVSANTPVEELVELYQQARAEVRGTLEREMDEKHLALALFIDELKESGLGWKARRQRWNERYPAWRYATESDPHGRRFALEARRTWSRLTGEPWSDRRLQRQADGEAE
jgi:hypothetical protein